MLEDLEYEDFAAQLNTKFTVSDADGVEVELVEALRREGLKRQSMFSLVFRGSADHFLPQQTYALGHSVLGDGELFLVPISLEADGYRYEAGFNRLIGD